VVERALEAVLENPLVEPCVEVKREVQEVPAWMYLPYLQNFLYLCCLPNQFQHCPVLSNQLLGVRNAVGDVRSQGVGSLPTFSFHLGFFMFNRYSFRHNHLYRPRPIVTVGLVSPVQRSPTTLTSPKLRLDTYSRSLLAQTCSTSKLLRTF